MCMVYISIIQTPSTQLFDCFLYQLAHRLRMTVLLLMTTTPKMLATPMMKKPHPL